jgi:hypothetical protein
MDINIKDLVKNNNAEFDSMRNGYAYYTIIYNDKNYKFPVDLVDVGNAELKRTEKAITMMRFIRKALDGGQFVNC